jgi:hypothetical protein
MFTLILHPAKENITRSPGVSSHKRWTLQHGQRSKESQTVHMTDIWSKSALLCPDHGIECQ